MNTPKLINQRHRILAIPAFIVHAYIHENLAWVVNVGIIHDKRINSCIRHVIADTHNVDIRCESRNAKKKGIQQMYAAQERFIGG